MAEEQRRGRGPRALATLVPRIAGNTLARRGFAEARVITDWPAIAGPALAAGTAPEKLVSDRRAGIGGTLYIRVADGSLATELQHQEPEVIERINRYFGYPAVARLAMHQGPVSAGARVENIELPSSLAAPGEIDDPQLADMLADVADDGLRGTLDRLSRAVSAANAKSQRS